MSSRRLFQLIFFVIILFGVVSCYYDNAEDIYGSVECDESEVSYTEDVLPLLELFCYQCHDNVSQLGGIDLEGFNKVMIYVEDESLLGSIKHLSGYSPMPQNLPQIPACDIFVFEKWIEEGAQNN